MNQSDHLTYRSNGYVYWRGVCVEHVNNYDVFKQCEAELIRRCEHLDNIGVTARTGTVVWFWPWFEEMPLFSPWVELMDYCPALYEHGMTEARHREATEACCAPGPVTTPNGDVILIFHKKESGQPVVIRWHGKEAIILTELKPDDLGGFYHPLKACDYHTARCGQPIHNGPCYADFNGVVDWMEQHHVDPVTVMEAVRAA
jgi:hypothetical protein